MSYCHRRTIITLEMQQVDFPRGKPTKAAAAHQAPDATALRGRQPKRAVEDPDRLFGRRLTKHDDHERSKRRRTTSESNRGDSGGGSTSRSLLPLGGGGVIHPHHKNKEAYIESLASISKIVPGLRVLAYCRQVHDDLAIFSLPSQWSAYMLPAQNQKSGGSGSLNLSCRNIVRPGQLLSVQVVKAVQTTTKAGPRRRIQVVADPATLNPANISVVGLMVRGQVTSVEDHGILIDLGIGRRGFVAWKAMSAEYTVDETAIEMADHNKLILSEGMLLDLRVLPGNSHDGLITQLELPCAKEVAKHCPPFVHKPLLKELTPGLLVQATVEKVIHNGVCVTFGGGLFRGAIELPHLGCHWLPTDRNESTAWRKVFDTHRSIKARILAVDASAKLVRLTLLPHLLDLRTPPTLHAVGTVLENATVLHVDPGVGALFALPDDTEDKTGEGVSGSPHAIHKPICKDEDYLAACRTRTIYVHISKAVDGNIEEKSFARDFAPSTQHTVRVLSTTNWVDGMATGATALGTVNAHVLSHDDIHVGQIYKQVPVVAQLSKGSVLVDLGMGVRAIIPPLHLFDQGNATTEFRTKLVQVKYAVGAKVDVRVLEVEHENKRCIVTAKKALLAASSPLLSFEQAKIGEWYAGFVTLVDSRGLSVTFFDNVYGRVPARVLVTDLGIDDHMSSFNIGDVVQCQVVTKKTKRNSPVKHPTDQMVAVDSENKGYHELTLRVVSGEQIPGSRDDDDDLAGTVRLTAGSILPARSLRVMKLVHGHNKGDGFVPGHAIVSIRAKYLCDSTSLAQLGTVECKLPFDQLMDSFDTNATSSSEEMDELAMRLLTPNKKINRKATVLHDPEKTFGEFRSTTGRLVVLSIRPKFIECMETQSKQENPALLLPHARSQLYIGAQLLGYVARKDPRHGVFVRFLNGFTGLVPKQENADGLDLFATVQTSVVSIDSRFDKPRVLLSVSTGELSPILAAITQTSYAVGDIVSEVEVEEITFHQVTVRLVGARRGVTTRARIHCTLADSPVLSAMERRSPLESGDTLSPRHPFHSWQVGEKLHNLQVVACRQQQSVLVLDLACRLSSSGHYPKHFARPSDICESVVSGVLSGVAAGNKGLYVMICPGLTGFVPALEVSQDPCVLNNLTLYAHPGDRYNVRILRHKPLGSMQSKDIAPDNSILLSLLEEPSRVPRVGELALCRVDYSIKQVRPPSVMVRFRGNGQGRCCVTELSEPGDWKNYSSQNGSAIQKGEWANGLYRMCRILDTTAHRSIFEVSFRGSRLEGDLDEDHVPEDGSVVPAYVSGISKKGCFLRLSRRIFGRVLLKNLSDSFVADPALTFPPGRLVIARVKGVDVGAVSNGTLIDLSLRESALVHNGDMVTFDDVDSGFKSEGTVSAVLDYGVFVRLNKSDLVGLAHKSECSDGFVKDVSKLFSPGDAVKCVIIKKDLNTGRLGLSLKASHFGDDSDAEGNSFVGNDDSDTSDSGDDEQFLQVDNDTSTSDMDHAEEGVEIGHNSSDSEESSGEGESATSVSFDAQSAHVLDTKTAFIWKKSSGTVLVSSNKTEIDDSSVSSDASEGEAAQSPIEVGVGPSFDRETMVRERALADGSADLVPQKPQDFERILAANPNNSELWIKCMAFHMAQSDIAGARKVAQRALDRIAFHNEAEKLNVWCAVLKMELNFGDENSVARALVEASRNNNPKHVYLRMSEMIGDGTMSAMSQDNVDEYYVDMCKKFRSKKQVWISHIGHLLKLGRGEEAFSVSKQALQTLPPYKHRPLMLRFAQMLYEYKSVEKGRSVFEGLLWQYPKKLDMLFVYLDKETKHGDTSYVRELFQRVTRTDPTSPKMKLSDKQMKPVQKVVRLRRAAWNRERS